MKKITILIAEDHSLIRQAWCVIFNADPRFEVVADTPSAAEAIELACTHSPDIVLMDINMPGTSGIEATELIAQKAPGTKVVGVSSHAQPAYAQRMMRSGAQGYVTKSSSSRELLKAIVEVHGGKKYICDEIKNAVAEQAFAPQQKSGLETLTRREFEIIEMVKAGLSSKDIAGRLYISEKTAEVHRYNILKKLNLRNTAALVNYVNHHMVN